MNHVFMLNFTKEKDIKGKKTPTPPEASPPDVLPSRIELYAMIDSAVDAIKVICSDNRWNKSGKRLLTDKRLNNAKIGMDKGEAHFTLKDGYSVYMARVHRVLVKGARSVPDLPPRPNNENALTRAT